jgi:DNA-binding transcriptional MerR regulator
LTPGAARPGAEQPASGLMNIGQVLELLRPEFNNISIPKIRFLEEQGLVSPERTPAGYRKYSHADVERLRYVLVLQRDHHQPHKRIAEILDAIDRGLEPPPLVSLTALSPDGMPSPESFRRHDDLRLSRKEVLKIAEISEELLVQLEEFGLVSPRAGTGHYDTDALVVCTTARELAEFGLEPRHLRAFKAAADREVGLVEQVVAPQRRATDAAARARTEDMVSQIAALSLKLHATLVKAGLTRL